MLVGTNTFALPLVMSFNACRALMILSGSRLAFTCRTARRIKFMSSFRSYVSSVDVEPGEGIEPSTAGYESAVLPSKLTRQSSWSFRVAITIAFTSLKSWLTKIILWVIGFPFFELERVVDYFDPLHLYYSYATTGNQEI